MSTGPSGSPWVAVARVLRPHGLRGIMRLQPLTGNPADLLENELPQLRFRRGDDIIGEAKLVKGDIHGGILFAQFEGIGDRSAAERFTNCDLVIPESDRWPLPEGTYYMDDLAGLEAREAGTGRVLGRVAAAREGAAHDYLELDLETAPGKATLLPLIPLYVPRVDIAGRFVEVVIPEGLLD
ncbi:16S rRNA processing protein RimM [Candidatus Poribacteria bacterium]|nr:16S rRNA processing protein RimM [Candidatus Poribacteria bacterium]